MPEGENGNIENEGVEEIQIEMSPVLKVLPKGAAKVKAKTEEDTVLNSFRYGSVDIMFVTYISVNIVH